MQPVIATTIFTLLCGSGIPKSRFAWFLLICGLPYPLQFLKFNISPCLKLIKFSFYSFNRNPTTKKTIMSIYESCSYVPKILSALPFVAMKAQLCQMQLQNQKGVFYLLEHNLNFQETRLIHCSQTTLLVEYIFIWPNEDFK